MMKIKKYLIGIGVALIVISSNVYATTTQVKWLTFTQAMTKAKVVSNNKPVMLVVYLNSCPVCRNWLNAVKQSKNFFAAVNKFVIPAKIEERAFLTLFGKYYAVKTVPAFFFFTKNGLLLAKFEGAPNNPNEFLKYLYRIKNYKKLLKDNIEK